MNKKYSKKEEEFSGISDMLEGRHHVIPIMSNDDEEAAEKVDIPQILPILTLRSSVLFPGSITPITVGREKSMKLVREVEGVGGILGAVLQKEPEVEQPGPGRPVSYRHGRPYSESARNAERQPDGHPARARKGRDQRVRRVGTLFQSVGSDAEGFDARPEQHRVRGARRLGPRTSR